MSEESKKMILPRLITIFPILYCVFLFFMDHAAQCKTRNDVSNKLSSKSADHWRRWRDQHSTMWFLHDWRVIDKRTKSPDAPWLHLKVCIFKTPGAQSLKAGEQAVLKIFDSNKLIYCSDKMHDPECDSLCYGEPLYIVNLDNDKMAIVSSGPGSIRTTVFAYLNGKVKMVLETGSKYYPEFAYPTKPRLNEPLTFHIIMNDILGPNGPTKASVYSWDEVTNSYMRKRVPFDRRFDTVK